MTASSPVLRALLFAGVLALYAAPARADSTSTAASDSSRRAITLPPIDVGGFMQLDYRQVFNGPIRHEFGIRRARLSLTGNAVPRVRYELTIQGDRGPDVQQVSILDAFAEVEIHRSTRLRVGQYKYEFDIEGNEADEALPVIDRSWAAIAIAGSLDPRNNTRYFSVEPAFPFRDRGLTLLEKAGWAGLDWRAAVGAFQGSGVRTDRDNRVSWVLQASVSRDNISASYGWMNTPFETGIGENFSSAWTAGFNATWKWSQLRAEMYDAESGVSIFQHEIRGGYALAVFRLHPAIDLAARWQKIRVLNTFNTETGTGVANGVDIAPRFQFLRDGERTGTWVGLDYMIRNAEPWANDLTGFNDGSVITPIRSDTWRSLVVARIQVVF
jgi:hypothetical protein